jgi:UDP-N-acetylmuramoyl-tripeptide--D-alanyl-D-alanine ligase
MRSDDGTPVTIPAATLAPVRLQASQIAAAAGGALVGPDLAVTGAAIDSRAVEGGELFVPIIAERDGHDFLEAALEAGAAAYLTARPPVGGTAIVVGDTTAALTSLATWARSQVGATVVGITGSVGKTTVKDLLAAVLSRRGVVAASAGSFNNELGVPLTILNAPDAAEALVVEMGARGIGQIAELCAIAAPRIGVVTRVAAAHTELFGTLDDVARAKGELVEALPADGGVAVLNAEDARVAAMARRTSARVLLFGEGADVVAEDVALDAELRPSFHLQTPWGAADVALAARGMHQVSNALAAAGAALAAGASLDDVVVGLADAAVSRWRMELVRLPAGAVVLNDTYNANPASMRAALEALAALPATRRAAVLGIMAELGARSADEHAAVGELARSLGIRVIAIGTLDYGGDVVGGIDEAVAALGRLGDGDAVLVKGSRIAGLEALVARL